MVALLGLFAAVALLSAGFGMVEIAQTWSSSATVFQQISARVDVGLSLLVFVTAAGFAGTLMRLDALAAATSRQAASPRPAPSPSPAPQRAAHAATPSTAPGAGPEVGIHRGITFIRVGDDYHATVNGTEIIGSTPDIIRARITRKLENDARG